MANINVQVARTTCETCGHIDRTMWGEQIDWEQIDYRPFTHERLRRVAELAETVARLSSERTAHNAECKECPTAPYQKCEEWRRLFSAQHVASDARADAIWLAGFNEAVALAAVLEMTSGLLAQPEIIARRSDTPGSSPR